VLLAGRFAGRRGWLEGLLAMLLTADSYLLIHYSSEARGYGPAVFFDFLAFDFLETYLAVGGRWRAVGFWAASVLSLLSHLMFVLVYAAFVLWSCARLVERGRGWRHVLGELAVCHAVPLAAFALLYVLDIRHLVIGGAPEYPVTQVLLSTLALTIGGPDTGWQAAVSAIAAAGLVVAALVRLRRAGSDRWVFYLMAVVVTPALFAATRPQALFVRYFLGSVAFLLLLLAELFGGMIRRGGRQRLAACLLLAAILAGNAWHTAWLLRVGRGDYLGALRYMAEHTLGRTVTIGSDHDFRNRFVLAYYTKYLGDAKDVVYYDQDAWPQQGPEWLLLHRISEGKPPPTVLPKSGHRYRLVKHYPHAALSGWDWYVYHKLHGAAPGTADDRWPSR
jgi:hypothetical protein